MTVEADDLVRLRAALQAAADVVVRHARAEIPFELKDGDSPVTAADREVDELLRRMLPRPGDGWLSEESADDGSRRRCARVWIVDPLDGTRSFVAGRPEYAVSIALVVDGDPVLGGVANPATGVSVTGGPGLGIDVRGNAVLPWSEGDGLRVLASRSEWKRGEWRDTASACRVLPVGSVASKLALVAAGAADATWTLQPKHEWDVAAGTALVLAAGGEVWLPRGGAIAWNRERPRFASFAAAGRGLRARAEAVLGSS